MAVHMLTEWRRVQAEEVVNRVAQSIAGNGASLRRDRSR